MLFTTWDQRMDYDNTITALKAIEELLIENTPGIRERHHGFPFGDPHCLYDFDFDYETISVGDALVLRQICALYSKLEPLRIGVDKEAVAFEKFLEAEAACRLSNLRFDRWLRSEYLPPSDLVDPIFRAREKIALILGEVPKLADLPLRLGPGATTNVKKQNASITAKFSSPLACSGPLVPYLSEVLYEMPQLWVDRDDVTDNDLNDTGIVPVELHNGRLSFVPKNAKTYRSIVVEPILNTMCQQGVGRYIANRLSAFGIDIRDQTKNQSLARTGSLTGDLATLDLSSASDMISNGLVRFLLPIDWYCFLKRFISSRIEYNGEIYDQAKFCSMGNGFTFPLETLIFYALADSAGHSKDKRLTSVYGDDIIVNTDRYEDVVRILEECGFSVNSKKSFATGPFRESCGADYLKGINIRPFYFKELISCERIFSFHNYLYRSGNHDVASKIREKFLSSDVVLFGPDGFGDGHLLGDWTPRPLKRDRGYCGSTFETYSHKARLERKLLPGDRVLPVYTIYVREDSRELTRSSLNTLHRFISRPALNWATRDMKEFRESFLAILESLGSIEPLPTRDGRTLTTLPGKARGYKRIKIYTLNS